MPSYKLHYFDIRGAAETARIMFHATGTKFEDVRIKPEDWPQLKSKSPTGKVPYLEVDGHVYPESFTIFRFLANRLGFAGKDEFEKATAESVVEFYRDSVKDSYEYLAVLAGRKEGDKDALYKDKFVPAITNTLPYVESAIKKSGSGFLVPSGVTWADIFIAENLVTLKKYGPDAFKDFKFVDEYIKKVHSVPKIKEYVDSRPDTPF